MIPGIDPKVDIAFKKVFGTPAWRDLTVSLVNAVLKPTSNFSVADLELLNPYSQRISPEDKPTILDLKARDESGRLFNVEMQMALVPALSQRLLYYWAQLYSRQLVEGTEYNSLRPTISICFLNANLFPKENQYHYVFELLERDHHIRLTGDQELHIVELPKSPDSLESLKKPLDFWVYFLNNGARLDADDIPAQLATREIRRAMEVLKVFSQDELERDLYESQLKAQRDHMAFVLAEKRAVQRCQQAEQQRQQAEQQRQQAEQQRQQAEQQRKQAEQQRKQAERRLEEVVAQAELEIRKSLVPRIQLSQRILGAVPTDDDALLQQSTDDLRSLAKRLEQQLPPQ